MDLEFQRDLLDLLVKHDFISEERRNQIKEIEIFQTSDDTGEVSVTVKPYRNN